MSDTDEETTFTENDILNLGNISLGELSSFRSLKNNYRSIRDRISLLKKSIRSVEKRKKQEAYEESKSKIEELERLEIEENSLKEEIIINCPHNRFFRSGRCCDCGN